MSNKGRLKKAGGKIGRFFNIRQWVGSEQLGEPLHYVKRVVKQAFVIPEQKKDEKEDFSLLVDKLGLTADQIRKKKNAFLRLCILFLFLAVLVIVYAFTHLSFGHYRVFFPSFVLFFVCLSFAFRYHFWYVQIKIQRLGCSFQEWCDYVLPGRKK